MMKKIVCVVLSLGLASCAGQQGGYYGGGQSYPNSGQNPGAQSGYYGGGQPYPNSGPGPGAQNGQYSNQYSYRDDPYYNQCRNTVDPAGVIAGALIGGLLGNAIGNSGGRGYGRGRRGGGGNGGAVIAGVVLGGVAGAALTSRMTCEDQSYAYRTYYDGLNSRRPNSRHAWTNPRSGNRGDFYVGDYYGGPGGYECANYSQSIWIDGRPEEATGRACRQPDGTWAIAN
jgi:surface antigen